MVWVQNHYGWALGFGIPAMILAVGPSCLVAASRAFRFQTTSGGGSPLARVCKLNVALPDDDVVLLYEELPEDASAMKGVERIEHTADLRFFDKAAVVVTAAGEEEAAAACAAPRNPWRLCAVTQVEEVKIVVRMLPLWASIAFFYAGTAQNNSTFVEQGMAMDAARVVGSIRVPPASLVALQMPTTIALIPLYDRALVPAARRLTGREKDVPDLARIGAGLAALVLAMAAAATVETARKRTEPPTTSILWLAPQYVLVGVGEVPTSIGQLDFFYSQAPAGMKTVCTAAGDYLSSLIVTAVSSAAATSGWIPDDLNEGHLDRFFWLMAGLGCLNPVAFTSCGMRYKSRKPC